MHQPTDPRSALIQRSSRTNDSTSTAAPHRRRHHSTGKSRWSRSFPAAALVAGVLVAFAAGPAGAQGGLTLPPSGANQVSSVTQNLGLVQVTIDYSSPDVTGPAGQDRRGQIWGALVPYGMANLGFGTCGDQCPWRAGANENTVFTVSHDVTIEGKSLAAGSYGLHMVPGEDEWTIIFSKDASSWGSFFYDASQDALRVQVEPRKGPFNEWLTYEFTDRQLASATVEMRWEELSVPWTIEVPNLTDLYVDSLEKELRGSAGFQWQSWNTAAQFALNNGADPAIALRWAQSAVSAPFVGQENFTTLSTLAQAQRASGDAAAAKATIQTAIAHPTATVNGLHQLGRQLLAAGETESAYEVFQTNAQRHPDTFPVHFGLARGLSALGRYEEAAREAEKSLALAPNEPNRQAIAAALEQLRQGQDIN